MSIDNLEIALEHKLLKQLYGNEQPQDCVMCGNQIGTNREKSNKGTDVCDLCAGKEHV